MKLNLLIFEKSYPIFAQLKIEEALLRLAPEAWCLLNLGSSETSIVMGRSAKPSEVLQERGQNIPPHISILRRFSGGGTVVVDEGTLFFTLIVPKQALDPLFYGTRELLSFTHSLIKPAFAPHSLEVDDHDFTLYGKKVGGNAQCFTDNTLLHHTSFLWSWEKENMNLLSYPKKTPDYRQNRSHEEFCGKLSHFFPSPERLIDNIISSLSSHFTIDKKKPDDELIRQYISTPHRTHLEIVSPANPFLSRAIKTVAE